MRLKRVNSRCKSCTLTIILVAELALIQFYLRRRLMTEQLYKCYQCDDPEVKFCSKQVGYPICEECYTERYLASYYEREYNAQYGED